MKVCILLPVYNDWRCLPRLLGELDKSLLTLGASASVVIINDGGDAPQNEGEFLNQDYRCIADFSSESNWSGMWVIRTRSE